jgi:predicted nucleic acid-binding Zn ribbon protein
VIFPFNYHHQTASNMPTYLYETIPASSSESPRRFEVKQSMKDAALTHDPATGEAVRRVLASNINFCAPDNTGSAAAACGTGCGCC